MIYFNTPCSDVAMFTIHGTAPRPRYNKCCPMMKLTVILATFLTMANIVATTIGVEHSLLFALVLIFNALVGILVVSGIYTFACCNWDVTDPNAQLARTAAKAAAACALLTFMMAVADHYISQGVSFERVIVVILVIAAVAVHMSQKIKHDKLLAKETAALNRLIAFDLMLKVKSDQQTVRKALKGMVVTKTIDFVDYVFLFDSASNYFLPKKA